MTENNTQFVDVLNSSSYLPEKKQKRSSAETEAARRRQELLKPSVMPQDDTLIGGEAKDIPIPQQVAFLHLTFKKVFGW